MTATTYERREALKRVKTCARKLAEALEELHEVGEPIAASYLSQALRYVSHCEMSLLQRIAAQRDRRGAPSPVQA
jgi:hypothetical protein